MNDIIAKTTKLYKSYHNNQIVSDLSLDIGKGSITGLLGPNGAGKTTSLRMLMGLSKPDSGNVVVFDRDITQHREFILKNIGALIDTPAFYGNLTAEENLRIICLMKGINTSEIDRVLELVGLSSCGGKKTCKFSLGMKQRLGIAIALLGNPEFVILDEPVNALDPAGIQEVRELIKTLAKEREITFLISSHLLSEIELISENVNILKSGNLIYQGKLESLLENTSRINLGVNDKQQAVKCLSDKNISAEIQQDCIVIESSCSIENISKLLIDAGIGINFIFHKTSSLEDIYMKLVSN